MGIFDFAKKKVILGTFQSDFDKFRKASLPVQRQVGEKIFEDIKMIGALSPANLARIQPELREKYKNLRNLSMKMGATDALDPDWAYAALMESVVLSLGDETMATKTMQDLMGWMAYIGVISRT